MRALGPTLLAAACLLAPTPPAVAQASPEEVTIDMATQVDAGPAFGSPIGAAARLTVLTGLGAHVRDTDEDVRVVCAAPIHRCGGGLLFQLDAGTGGGKLSLGVAARARVHEDDFRGSFGTAARIALVRTWGSPIGTEPDLTYLGHELDFSFTHVHLTLGALFRISGQAGPRVLFAWGLGLGL
jgi:hypothetical protein